MQQEMELRHLRYFQAVAEALSFTKAAAQLRVAQPALSRQVQDLEDEIGADLLRRSPRGVALTPEGRLFLDEVRELLKRVHESVEKVRALARGQFGELHIGYSASLTVEILPPALAAFQKAFPSIDVRLHDASERELTNGLQSGALELAVMPYAPEAHDPGLDCELLLTYPFCVALASKHRFARLKSIPLVKLVSEPLIGYRRDHYAGYYRVLERMFAPLGIPPHVSVECDSTSSFVTEIETRCGIGLASPIFEHATGSRVLYRPLTGTAEAVLVGIAHAKKGHRTPAGENLCAILRKISKRMIARRSKTATRDAH